MSKHHTRANSTSPQKKMSKRKSSNGSNGVVPTIKQFAGSTLQNNYVIGSQIGLGSFGQVFEIIDMKKKDLPLVVKFSSNLTLA